MAAEDSAARDAGACWGSVAAGWARWWPVFEAAARPLSERLIERARIGPGSRVLDVATGIGEPALTAAPRALPGGRVLAIDVAAGMLDQARERAAREGITNVTFREMDAAAPDLAAEGFDALTCRWGLMFMPDVAATLAAWRRLLAPGGRLAIAVWAAPEQVPMIALPNRIVRETLDLPAPDPDAPGAFRLCDADALQETLRRVGFSEITCEPMSLTFTFASVAAFIQFRREASTLEADLQDFPSERRDAAWQAVAQALGPYTDATGSVRLPNVSYCLAATR
jgi:SAM-dependent methyltransferase